MFEGLLASLSAIKPLTLKTASVCLLLSGSLIFSPQNLLTKFGLYDFSNSNKIIIGLLFLFSLATLLTEAVFTLCRLAAKSVKEGEYTKAVKHHLANLSGDEKKALRHYFDRDVSNVHFSMAGGVAAGLQGKGILSRSSNMGVPGSGDSFPYLIQPVAKKAILDNPSCLD